MSAIILDGRAVSAAEREAAAQVTASLIDDGVIPCLAVLVVGGDPASQIYVSNKEKACRKAGIRSLVIRLRADCSQKEVEETISNLNGDPFVHGILVQLPLPRHLDTNRIISLIRPGKDVDGFHAVNSGKLMNGQEGFVPCTPLGVMRLLEAYAIPVEGRHAVVIGRSNIVGKPMAMLLLSKNATVTICHSKTTNLPELTRQADILVSAVGRPCFVTPDMVKSGAVVIDVGVNRIDGHVVGDVDPAVSEVAGFLTPVPGGVGQMTVAMLLANTVEAARKLDQRA